MLNKQGFDLWADGYDKTVQISEENNQYPFAGYRLILNTIFNKVMERDAARVLDIGFGTGVLTSKLYENGHLINGVDFSTRMIELAREKMPMANLVEGDIADGLPEELKIADGLPEELKIAGYDFIISTYALHHLTDEAKVEFIKELLPLLAEDGEILIGDIAFRTRQELEACRTNSLEFWDHDEFYFVFEELESMLSGICYCKYEAISHCGGVIELTQK
ncbi:class I SAM-dependent methyltransferase [Mesobacillus subterraneus]|uniref:Class I SAM-dependent methyltransferase n=1 Tax=Mesobacillus subterraneus TaxID=285983 RepID=A0A3R9FKX0_9BACI|nr:class I SAM-dependent methyltransferase [Mesobacillus subterraneus]RSD28795.1 class I SAM-dependent methyltransferase [Mesobacillus subterraneus]